MLYLTLVHFNLSEIREATFNLLAVFLLNPLQLLPVFMKAYANSAKKYLHTSNL
ncbi:hypothetical protein Aasi_0367 [Candidatus Amoebophilus asiaticus 5a2]|uniref:Uncharacterized protein n=1 Tax=Amoebophilus asiaticus (strain 5a2) TaxID=452471 RepID=B3ERD8_AMOA5|nr:hypothetical protein Aasi_0367 [Candidatus Amoebophilus asiaticus 5a2]